VYNKFFITRMREVVCVNGMKITLKIYGVLRKQSKQRKMGKHVKKTESSRLRRNAGRVRYVVTHIRRNPEHSPWRVIRSFLCSVEKVMYQR
jgi:predicted DNA repair protein MutK